MNTVKRFDLLGMPIFADVKNEREQAQKVLEEASELCESAKKLISLYNKGYGDDVIDLSRRYMLDEFADVIQTLQNLAACFGITCKEVYAALGRCIDRNEERGRY